MNNEGDRRIIAWCIARVLLVALLGVVAMAWMSAEAKAQDATVFADGFEPGAAGGPPPDPCDDPLVGPEGFAVVHRTWAQLFTPRDGAPVPTYYNSNGFPVPVGAQIGTIQAAMFVPGPGEVWTLFWDPAQSNPPEGYRTARPADAMFLGISECPGDLRMKPGWDPCAKWTNTGSLNANTVLAGPHPLSCTLEPGKAYWINVTPHHPTTLQHACRPVPSSAQGCDVQARSSGN